MALAGCAPEPEPVSPALWEVTGPDGEQGWLFGTIHALDRPADWRSGEVARAFDAADTVMVELLDPAEAAQAFAELSESPGHPPPLARVDPARRETVREALDQHCLTGDYSETETWALALMLAQVATRDTNSEYGIDRAVVEAAGERRLVELEGGAGQLAIFDALPEAEQADLLAAVAEETTRPEATRADLAHAWRSGELAAIERETGRGMLADPELRQALLVRRNTAWLQRIVSVLKRGEKTFVAVGTAHLVGSDGLPAMLEQRGFTVRRID